MRPIHTMRHSGLKTAFYASVSGDVTDSTVMSRDEGNERAAPRFQTCSSSFANP